MSLSACIITVKAPSLPDRVSCNDCSSWRASPSVITPALLFCIMACFSYRTRLAGLLFHGSQALACHRWFKGDSGLFQNPDFYFRVPLLQQVQGTLAVVLFNGGTRLMALNLSDDTGGHFYPFRQGAERPP